MHNIDIRLAVFDDAEALAMMHAMVLPVAWSAEEFSELLSSGVSAYVAVKDQRYVIGLVLTRCAADEVEILTLGVLEELRGLGVARRLVLQALQDVALKNVEICFLEVQEDNADAIGFYRRLGFVQIGRRKDYYRTSQGKKDALLMSCHVSEHIKK